MKATRTDDDLGALLSRLLELVVEREAPILESHGLTMWEYVILGRLAVDDGITQKELALRSRRDATRLIAHLDALADRGLIERTVDHVDRRRRTVRLTSAGRELVGAARDDIRRMEAELTGGRASELKDAVADALGRGGASAGDTR